MRKRKAKEKLKSNIGWYPDYKEYRDAFNDKIKAAHYLAEFSGDVSGFTDILVKNVPNRYSHKFILLAKKFFNLTYNKKTMAFRKGSRELPGDVDYRDFSKELFRENSSKKNKESVSFQKGVYSKPDAISEAIDILVFYRKDLGSDDLECLHKVIKSAKNTAL